MTPEGLVLNVQRFSVHDGPGVRTTVFMKGCPLRCAWCHNPESQSARQTFVRLSHRCMHCGRCSADELADPVVHGRGADDVTACPTGALQTVGTRMSVSALIPQLLRDRVFFDESGGGVTVSGGEPLSQSAFVGDLLAGLRSEGVHTTLDTCGYGPWADLQTLALSASLILFDLKLMDDGRHRAATGVSNRLILDNLKALATVHPQVWIRIPVIPGVNDAPADLAATAAFVRTLPGVHRVDLLPYHATGAHKFGRLGLEYALPDTTPPRADDLKALAAVLRATGLTTTIGGHA